jgi:hypothetical protein
MNCLPGGDCNETDCRAGLNAVKKQDWVTAIRYLEKQSRVILTMQMPQTT